MPPRLGHKKSRNGCVACKRRRVKCDEQKPCGACMRYGWQCSLVNDLSPAASSDHTSNDQVAVTAPQQLPLPQVFEPREFAAPVVAPPNREDDHETRTSYWLQDLELIHHFSVSTWREMQSNKFSEDVWQHTVPRIACRHDYLMHGVLATSALHFAYLQPSKQRRYYIISTYHQNLAIAGFRAAITTVTRQTADPVFVASILIAAFAFASSASKAEDSQETFSLSDVAEILILIRGIEETLSAGNTRQWVVEGPLATMIYIPQGPPEVLMAKDDMIFLPHLLELHRLIERRAEEMPPHAVVSLTEGLKDLDDTYELMCWARPMMNCGLVMRWPNVISMNFLALIQDRHPIALVILSYFCAMIHYHETRWFWYTWGARVIELIRKHLDADWQKWVEWPAEVIEKNLKVREPDEQ